MHDTAMEYGALFFKTYANDLKNLTIIDLGSQDVNGSLRSVAPADNRYIGVDFINANGVDIVINDPYTLPFENESVDIVVSSSCFEHSEFFWLLFNEVLRVLKPTGLLYINAPSNGMFHRYPVDCWRFYPDSGIALQNWGKRSGFNCALIESFIGVRKTDIWNDFVGIFIKDALYSDQYPNRILSHLSEFSNAHVYGAENILNFIEFSKDQSAPITLNKMIVEINKIINNKST